MSNTTNAQDSIDSAAAAVTTSKEIIAINNSINKNNDDNNNKQQQEQHQEENDDNDGACSNDDDYNNYYDEDGDYMDGGCDDDLMGDGGCCHDDDDDDDDPYANDPEYFEYEIYPMEKIDLIVEKKCERVRTHLKLGETFDVVYLLQQFKWNAQKIIDLYDKDRQRFMETYLSDNNNNNSSSSSGKSSSDATAAVGDHLHAAGISSKLASFLNIFTGNNKSATTTKSSTSSLAAAAVVTANKQFTYCSVCCIDRTSVPDLHIDCLPECMHYFCLDCWRTHFEMLIKTNIATSMFECMQPKCSSAASKEFIIRCLNRNGSSTDPCDLKLIDQFRRLISKDLIKESEDLQLCPGEQTVSSSSSIEKNRFSSKLTSATSATAATSGAVTVETTMKKSCNSIVWAKSRPAARRVQCSTCETQYCFLCALPYHAPNTCDTIRKWNLKCQDDSETRNYLLVHTQDCPKCKVCIEKNGGCSHMTCNRCKHEFCWVCLNDWKTHGANYDCNRYKGNPAQDNAREALNRYTHYYHRWINHSNSLKFEKALREQCQKRIQEKIMNRSGGTLVDWEFLNEATDLLTKARYTLQYTYPYAYFSENNECKLLFENIQAELEREVENLSHSLEKVNLNEKFNIRTQMAIVEKRRRTLLKDFIQ